MPRILPMLGLILALVCGAYAQTSPPTPATVLTLTLQEALDRAKTNSQQLLSADLAARIAHEDKVQAKAALLPTVNWQHGYIYTQPNGTDTGIFVGNNGPHEYINMADVHADVDDDGAGQVGRDAVLVTRDDAGVDHLVVRARPYREFRWHIHL